MHIAYIIAFMIILSLTLIFVIEGILIKMFIYKDFMVKLYKICDNNMGECSDDEQDTIWEIARYISDHNINVDV